MKTTDRIKKASENTPNVPETKHSIGKTGPVERPLEMPWWTWPASVSTATYSAAYWLSGKVFKASTFTCDLAYFISQLFNNIQLEHEYAFR